ncbi:MAG: 50S ribosomal protein L39e [Candidatus Micrarchaeia archaeon]
MGKKSAQKKARLGKALKQNRRLPIFAVAKTNRRISQNQKRRSWKTQKLGYEN